MDQPAGRGYRRVILKTMRASCLETEKIHHTRIKWFRLDTAENNCCTTERQQKPNYLVVYQLLHSASFWGPLSQLVAFLNELETINLVPVQSIVGDEVVSGAFHGQVRRGRVHLFRWPHLCS